MDIPQRIRYLQEQRDEEIKRATTSINQKYNGKIRSLAGKMANDVRQERQRVWQDAILPTLEKLKSDTILSATPASSQDPGLTLYTIEGKCTSINYLGKKWRAHANARATRGIADFWLYFTPCEERNHFLIDSVQFVVLDEHSDKALVATYSDLLDNVAKRVKRGWRPKVFHGNFDGNLPNKYWEDTHSVIRHLK